MTPLTYQDALDLKECGYPQEGNGRYFRITDGLPNTFVTSKEGAKIFDEKFSVYAPLLGELVRECGKDFKNLLRVNDYPEWYAYAKKSIGDKDGEFDGSTPEQAVKNLYCALNRKSDNV